MAGAEAPVGAVTGNEWRVIGEQLASLGILLSKFGFYQQRVTRYPLPPALLAWLLLRAQLGGEGGPIDYLIMIRLRGLKLLELTLQISRFRGRACERCIHQD